MQGGDGGQDGLCAQRAGKDTAAKRGLAEEAEESLPGPVGDIRAEVLHFVFGEEGGGPGPGKDSDYFLGGRAFLQTRASSVGSRAWNFVLLRMVLGSVSKSHILHTPLIGFNSPREFGLYLASNVQLICSPML